jgi:hypothetical protein
MTRARLMMSFVVMVLFAVPAHAGVETCHVVNAKGIGSLTGPTTTESQIIGGGLLHGTTSATLNFTGAEGTVLLYEGELLLTTDHGTLTYSLSNGTFDLATGEFTADAAVVSGTGRFEGATGDLFFHGFVLEDGVSFIDDEISGSICLELP